MKSSSTCEIFMSHIRKMYVHFCKSIECLNGMKPMKGKKSNGDPYQKMKQLALRKVAYDAYDDDYF